MEVRLDRLVQEHWALIVAPADLAPDPPLNFAELQRVTSRLLEDRLVAAGSTLAAFDHPHDAVMHLHGLALELPEPALMRESAVHARLMCAIVLDLRWSSGLSGANLSSALAVMSASAAILCCDADEVDRATSLVHAICGYAPELRLVAAHADFARHVRHAVLRTLEGSISAKRWEDAEYLQGALERARAAHGWSPKSREEQARARLLFHVGQAEQALATASTAIEIADDPGDRQLGMLALEELRRAIGFEGDPRRLHPTPELTEGLLRGSVRTSQVVEALDRGEVILADKFDSLAEYIDGVAADAVDQGLDPRAVAVLKAKLALARNDTRAFETLRPLLSDCAAGRGPSAIEAAVLLALDQGADDLAAVIERGLRELTGIEPLSVARAIGLAWMQAPPNTRARTWPLCVRWLEHLVTSIESHVDWSSPEQTMLDQRPLFPEFELTCFFIYTMIQLATELDDTSRLWSLMHRLFLAFTGRGLRLARGWRCSAEPAALSEVEPILAELSATARVRDLVKLGELRSRLLSRLYASRRAPHAPSESAQLDRFAFPQALVLRTASFIHTDDLDSRGATFVVDNFAGGPRVSSPERREDLDRSIEALIPESDPFLDPRVLARLSRVLVPWPASSLPPAFGLRASGIVQAVPWSALTTVDGVTIGDIAVPVLLTSDDDPEAALAPIRADEPVLLVALPGEAVSAAEAPTIRRGEGDRRGLMPLPGSRGEAMGIRDNWRGETTLLLGADATRYAMRAALARANPRVLHLATHGFCHPEEPACSYVALTGASGGGDHDALTFDEIGLMDLRNVRLVVLSACSTMRGTVRQGEGILALSWAFRAAGAGVVISTRWDVADDGAAILWPHFYAALAGGASISEAFRRALSLLRTDPRFRAPYEWASYQIVA